MIFQVKPFDQNQTYLNYEYFRAYLFKFLPQLMQKIKYQHLEHFCDDSYIQKGTSNCNNNIKKNLFLQSQDPLQSKRTRTFLFSMAVYLPKIFMSCITMRLQKMLIIIIKRKKPRLKMILWWGDNPGLWGGSFNPLPPIILDHPTHQREKSKYF